MPTYIIAFVLSLLVAAGATPVVAALGSRLNAIDRPDGNRKVHTRAVPRIGGLAVALAFFAPLIIVALYDTQISTNLIYKDSGRVFAVAAAAITIIALGVYDDFRGASPWLKLAVQFGTAAFMYNYGFRIEKIASFNLGMMAFPVTVFWLVAVTNALNLIDGLDGLAAGTALFAVIVLFGVSFAQQNVLLSLLAAALGGSLLGFLFFNVNPARIFLGDCGSMFLGFMLGTISIWTSMKGATLAALGIPVLALGLPILDTSLSFVRRLAKGVSPFSADRGHIHHRFLAIGLSHSNTVYTLYLTSAIFGLGAVAMLKDDDTRQATALALVMAAVILLLRKVGMVNGPKNLIQRPPPHALRDEARATARRIRACANLDEAWGEITAIAPRFGVEEIRLARRERDAQGGDAMLVLRWKSPRDGNTEPEISAAWKTDVAPHETAPMLDLKEGDVSFGNLQIVYASGAQPDGALLELINELFRDALVDVHFRLASSDGAGLASGEQPAVGASSAEAPVAAAPQSSEAKDAKDAKESKDNGEPTGAAKQALVARA